jgi:carbon storage regulator
MLVLSRKTNQRLIIDNNIVVTILRVAGGTVRIGIEAPVEVAIRRNELPCRATAAAPLLQSEKKLAENCQAASFE